MNSMLCVILQCIIKSSNLFRVHLFGFSQDTFQTFPLCVIKLLLGHLGVFFLLDFQSFGDVCTSIEELGIKGSDLLVQDFERFLNLRYEARRVVRFTQ